MCHHPRSVSPNLPASEALIKSTGLTPHWLRKSKQAYCHSFRGIRSTTQVESVFDFGLFVWAIGRRPKADNFGSYRGKREKDFWEEFLSLGVTNNTQEQEGKRTYSLSQLEVVKRGV
jgi:hypothetical protein